MPDTVLALEQLRTHFVGSRTVAKVLNGVTFEVGDRETLGLVGETGSGKSVTALSILGLLPPNGRIVEGRILFQGENLAQMPERRIQKIRGKQISLIVQNPKAALNPLVRVGDQMVNVFSTHLGHTRKPARAHTLEMLSAVGFADPDRVSRSYPHELSGGMAQRVVIAIAIGTSPRLIIADEPTTGLDATVQIEVLDLIFRMSRESKASVLIITHDLGIVAAYCDRVAMMHAGVVVENARTQDFLLRPAHPYSAGLLDAVRAAGGATTISIGGRPPDPSQLPSGCTYRLRCPLASELCEAVDPSVSEVQPDHQVKCHHSASLMDMWIKANVADH